MSKDADRPPKRGEAKWKEVREGVAKSNDGAKRARVAEREAFARVRTKALGKPRQAPHGY